MGWKVVGVAAAAACCTVFLGSASASAPPGPTSAVKALGVIKQTSTARPGLRAAAPATSTGSTASNYAIDGNLQLTYHGGPVMHTHTLYVIYWVPSGFFYGASSGDSTTFENDINQYVQDVAADSGKTSNAYGAISQYHDGGGASQYNVTYGGSVVSTTAFPTTNNCGETAPCLTDQQLITQIDAVVGGQGWSGGLTNEYALVLPNGVTTCTDTGGGVCSDNYFCAYHSAYNHAPSDTTPFIYLNLPYELDTACHNDFTPGAQPEPHWPSNADTTIDDMSHEEREAATDPLGNAWYDAAGNEADDKCIDTYGSTIGPSVGPHADFNQLINGNHYDTQTEWSNLKKGCYQMGAPTVSLDSTSVVEEGSVGITGANFFMSGSGMPVVKFNGITATVETVDSPTHLTVGVPDGNTTGKVTVQAIGGTGTSTQTFGLKPNILSLSDSHDVTGTKITVNGTGFFGVKSVKFGTVTGVFSSVAPDGTSLKVVVPAGAVTGNLTVTTAGGTSDPADFTVTPKITSFTPAKAAALSNVTIVGTGLAGASDVQFGGVSAAGVSVDTATKIVAQVPEDAVSGVISVLNGPDTANSVLPFTPLPKVSSLSDVDGKAGNTVAITGGVLSGVTQVKFGTVLSPLVTPVSATEVDAEVPGAPFSTGKVTVIAGATTAMSTQTFSVTKVTSISPLTAAAGATVTISGQGLGSTTSVDFNNHTGVTPSTATPSSVKVVVPSDATDGVLTVHTLNIDVSGINTPKPFKPLPRIVSFDKSTYEAGCTVTVTGTNLSVAGPVSGKLGSVAITPTSVTPTSFQFLIPANAVTGTVSYTDAAGTTVSTAKVNVVPTITGDPNPNEATPGAKIVLSGTTFTGTTSVKFGADTHSGRFVVTNGGTTLTVTVPVTAISGAISVTNAGGTTQTTNPFSVDPVINSFTPTSGPTGTEITVTGTGFTGASGVTFAGGTSATPTNVTGTSLKVVVPNGALTGTIQVETNTGGADVLSAASSGPFTVTLSAALTSPTHGDYSSTASFTGTALGTITEVDFNGVPGTGLSASVDGQSLQVTVPASGSIDGAITLKVGGTTTITAGGGAFDLLHIVSVSRNAALPGSSITINGEGFTGATHVTFGGAESAGFNVDSDTQITVTVPAGETGTLEVVNGGTADAPSIFTIDSLSGVVINEVRTDSSGFIELYSPNGAVDLRDAQIVFEPAGATDHTSDESIISIINPTLQNGHFYELDITNLNTTGGGLALEYPNGTIVNTMGYGTANNPFTHGTAIAAPASGHSVGRHPDGESSGNDSVDFIDEAAPTKGAANN